MPYYAIILSAPLFYNHQRKGTTHPMVKSSYLQHLVCSDCAKTYPADQVQTYCSECSSPLLPQYDLVSIKATVDRDQIARRPRGMWRWRELLPVTDPGQVVSLGEGDTPLLKLGRLGSELGLSRCYLKDEAFNPTGSFKARGLSAAVSKASELGVRKVVLPSAGNAGGALAAYAARAGMDAVIYMPKNSPQANIIECRVSGATVELVDGLIDLAGKYAGQKAAEGWFNMSTFKEPYRVEGKKILGYEIAEALGWKLPDVIIYPTGGGTGLVGMWKAFSELEQLEWLESNLKPRMIAVQAEGCAPVVEAIHSGAVTCQPWENAHTIATGLCVPKSFADRLILDDIRSSGGTAFSVADGEILHWQGELARKEGIFTCPEGAATLVGLMQLLVQKLVSPEETIVLFNTASGLKYIGAEHDRQALHLK